MTLYTRGGRLFWRYLEGRLWVDLSRAIGVRRTAGIGAFEPFLDGDRTRHIEGEYNFASAPHFSFSLSLQAAR
jgi:hypothetical protein